MGRYIFANTLTAVIDRKDFKKNPPIKPINLYARHNWTYVIKFHRRKFRKAIENLTKRIKQEKIDFLKSIDIFSRFATDTLKPLAKYLTKRTINRGDWLFKEGELA